MKLDSITKVTEISIFILVLEDPKLSKESNRNESRMFLRTQKC